MSGEGKALSGAWNRGADAVFTANMSARQSGTVATSSHWWAGERRVGVAGQVPRNVIA